MSAPLLHCIELQNFEKIFLCYTQGYDYADNIEANRMRNEKCVCNSGMTTSYTVFLIP